MAIHHVAHRRQLLAGISMAAIFMMATPAYSEECFQMVERSDLRPQVIDGEEVFVMDREALIPDCNLYQKARQAAVALKEKNQTLLATVEELNNKYKDLYDAKENYYQLVLRYEGVLNQSSDLVQDFETHADKWVSLQQQYAQLVEDYDKLSDTYRDIAMNFSTPVAFHLGGGVTEEEGFAGLVGVGIYRFNLWGFLQNENSGIMATYTFPWSSLSAKDAELTAGFSAFRHCLTANSPVIRCNLIDHHHRGFRILAQHIHQQLRGAFDQPAFLLPGNSFVGKFYVDVGHDALLMFSRFLRIRLSMLASQQPALTSNNATTNGTVMGSENTHSDNSPASRGTIAIKEPMEDGPSKRTAFT